MKGPACDLTMLAGDSRGKPKQVERFLGARLMGVTPINCVLRLQPCDSRWCAYQDGWRFADNVLSVTGSPQICHRPDPEPTTPHSTSIASQKTTW